MKIKGKRGGRRPGSGRKKGTPNKFTGALKDMVLRALNDAGGVEYLVKQARSTPGPFLALVGKLLPLNVAGDITHRHVARLPVVEKSTEAWTKNYIPLHPAPSQRQ